MTTGLKRIGDQEDDGQQLLMLSCDRLELALHVMAVLTLPAGLAGATPDGWWRVLRAIYRQRADEAKTLLEGIAMTDCLGTTTVEVLALSPAGLRLVIPMRMTIELGLTLSGEGRITVDYDGDAKQLMGCQIERCTSEAVRLKNGVMTHIDWDVASALEQLAHWLRIDMAIFQHRGRRSR